jgi:hypothetical protein
VRRVRSGSVMDDNMTFAPTTRERRGPRAEPTS